MIGNKAGNAAESFACKFLEKQGYKILTRNYTDRYGEIDIVAEKDGYIVFAEVKARKTGSLVGAKEAVTPDKQLKIIKTSMKFLQSFDRELQPRYDVIAVELADGRVCAVKHIKSAFDADGLL